MKKNIIPFVVIVFLLSACKITKKVPPGCDNLIVNVGEGTMNGISPDASMEKIKKQFPCFTGESAEGQLFNYGGGVFFLDHDFYFYTHHDYLEVRKEFKGKVSVPLIGKTEYVLPQILGKPDKIVGNMYLYKQKYGVLRLEVRYGVVQEIGIHKNNLEQVVRFCEDNY